MSKDIEAPLLTLSEVVLNGFAGTDGLPLGYFKGSFRHPGGTLRYRLYAMLPGGVPVAIQSMNDFLEDGDFIAIPTHVNARLSPFLFGPNTFNVYAFDLTQSGQDSSPSLYTVTQKLPAPFIASASASASEENGIVSVNGQADYHYQPIRVEIAGQIKYASTDGNRNWRVQFTGIEPGTYAVTAQTDDRTSVFLSSDVVSASVTVKEPPIVPVIPLMILSPEEGRTVPREILVRGVASPGKGEIKVTFGGGEAFAIPDAGGFWSVKVSTQVPGEEVLLSAEMPQTSERVTRFLKVEPFGEWEVLRAARSGRMSGTPRKMPYGLALSGFAYPGHIISLYVNFPGREWMDIAQADESGNWSFEGQIENFPIQQSRYRLRNESMPSEEKTGKWAIFAPYILSHQDGDIIGQTVTFSGVTDFNHPPVKLTTSSGLQLFITPLSNGPDLEWNAEIDSLPAGPLVVTVTQALENGGSLPFDYEERSYNFTVIHS